MILRVALVVASLALLPAATAHFPHGPNLRCEDQRSHDYLLDRSRAGEGGLPRLVASPTCPESDPSLAFGGAFLDARHHGRLVCLTDDVYAVVPFFVLVDADGDGTVTPDVGLDRVLGPFERCATLAKVPPGADGGWWILVSEGGTAGHITA